MRHASVFVCVLSLVLSASPVEAGSQRPALSVGLQVRGDCTVSTGARAADVSCRSDEVYALSTRREHAPDQGITTSATVDAGGRQVDVLTISY
jgi:hypothetical protein